MKKIFVISIILFLITFTAIIKNSTKRIDDEIFTKEVSLRDLKKDLEKMKLEYEFLSSAERLIQYQELYFDDQLVKKNLNEIKIIDKKLDFQDLIN
tara:strand:- start:246 stop:533 length:288 start_codon:yes stop_codon:yes gene_type:complete